MYNELYTWETAMIDDAPTRWGRVRFGRGTVPAMRLAAPIGALLAAGFGVVAVLSDAAGPRPLVGGTVVALVSFAGLTGLVWAMLVDRRTLRGATDRPEESVETVWFDAAARGAFTDTLIVTGIALALLAVTGADIPAIAALTGTVVVALTSVSVRYLVARRRG
ncbi:MULTISPECIES: hypothetical protein [Pseudonocardia]|uniref:Uncharacterized protein n=2 Tax=Pseudonocardia TaxID=1847 RepID=A0A1Y2N056_PSEAH|nr:MULTISPECIES: hypothetical protein [Pseudonocardia]OSY40825.1 hypothetical protein BG845_02584 [Pseudonocardia autotrophica]TDN71867.1 hypothetical protein C8E95_0902 [Pseudonocardia autotrophica]BBG02555.1 hypothetical protein Pdca_37640 [Pseudonocardia autotrophica]GEC24614.1 hypothetical protein PSA01_16430 [Pseudonocardia saturnea]